MTLKVLRVIAKLSQAGVAAALQVDQSAVSNWECGKCRPAKEVRAPLAAIYRVSIAELDSAIDETCKEGKGRRKH